MLRFNHNVDCPTTLLMSNCEAVLAVRTVCYQTVGLSPVRLLEVSPLTGQACMSRRACLSSYLLFFH